MSFIQYEKRWKPKQESKKRKQMEDDNLDILLSSVSSPFPESQCVTGLVVESYCTSTQVTAKHSTLCLQQKASLEA